MYAEHLFHRSHTRQPSGGDAVTCYRAELVRMSEAAPVRIIRTDSRTLPDFMRLAVAETSHEMAYATVDDKDCSASLINARGTATTDDDLDLARSIGLALLISSVFWSLTGLSLWYFLLT
jgi:hypothetical protein